MGIHDLGAAAAAAAASRASAAASAAVLTDAQDAASSAALKIFAMIDTSNSGTISVNEAERIVLRLNSRLHRSYGENDVKAFFNSITADSETITQDEFVAAFQRLVQA